MPNIEISEDTFKLLCELQRDAEVDKVGELVEQLAELGATRIGISIAPDSDQVNQITDQSQVAIGQSVGKAFEVSKDSSFKLEMDLEDGLEELSIAIPGLDHIVPTVLTEFRSRDLVNVEMVKAYVDGKPFYHKRWNQTLFHVIELLLGRGVGLDEIVDKLQGFATVGKNLEDFLSYNEELDISHKIQNPKFVWPLIENLSRFWEVDVEIHFKWENNARLELRGLSAELKTNRQVEHKFKSKNDL